MDKKDLNFRVYDYIKKNKKLLPHSEKEKSKISYHCKKLMLEGLIKKKGYATWEVLRPYDMALKGSKIKDNTNPTHSKNLHKKIRGHGFKVVVKLPKIRNWDKRTIHFDKIGLKYRSIRQGQAISLRGWNVWVCSSSLVLHFPKELSIFGRSAWETRQYCYNLSLELVKSFERKINANFRVNGKYQLRDAAGHYGELGNELAEKLHKDRNSLFIFGSDGKEWLRFDFSWKQFIEGETTHPKKAMSDMDEVISPFFNRLRAEPEVLDHLGGDLQKITQIMLKQQETMQKLSEIVLKQGETQLEQQKVSKATQEQLMASATLQNRLLEMIVDMKNK